MKPGRYSKSGRQAAKPRKASASKAVSTRVKQKRRLVEVVLPNFSAAQKRRIVATEARQLERFLKIYPAARKLCENVLRAKPVLEKLTKRGLVSAIFYGKLLNPECDLPDGPELPFDIMLILNEPLTIKPKNFLDIFRRLNLGRGIRAQRVGLMLSDQWSYPVDKSKVGTPEHAIGSRRVVLFNPVEFSRIENATVNRK